MQLQLVAFEPQGTEVKAILPFPKSFTATSIRNKIGEGALELVYDKNTLGHEWLMKPCEIAIKANIGSAQNFGELVGHRYLVLDDNTDLIARAGDDATIRTHAQPIGWLFGTALVNPLSGQKEKDRPYRRFKAQTVGQVFNTLLAEAQNLGCLPGITKNWTGALDSNGQGWGATYNWTFNVGDTLLDVLNKMAEDSRCDVIMATRQLRLYKPGTMGSFTNTSKLRVGKELLSAPREVDRSRRRTHALAVGQNSIYAAGVENPNLSTTEWGSWYTFLNIDDDKLTDIQAKAKSQLRPLAETSYALAVGISMHPDGVQPYKHYKLGDWVAIATALLTPEQVADPALRFQVERITLRSDERGVLVGEVELGKKRPRPVAKTAARTAMALSAARPLAAVQRGISTTNTGDTLARVAFTTNAATIANAAGQVTIGTLSAPVWSEGRVYEIVVKRAFEFVGSGAHRFRLRVHRGSVSGTTNVCISFHELHAAAAGFVRFDQSYKMRRASGAGDLTRTLVLTCEMLNGTAGATVQPIGNSTDNFGEFYLRDIGPEEDWPDAPTIT